MWPPDHFHLHMPCFSIAIRFSSSTEQSSASRLLKRHRRRRKQRPPRMERVRVLLGEAGLSLAAPLTRGLGLVFVDEERPPLPCLSSQTSSFSSVTDSTMSLNIITVTLNMGMEGPDERGGEGLQGFWALVPSCELPPQRSTTSWASPLWARVTSGVTEASTSAPS